MIVLGQNGPITLQWADSTLRALQDLDAPDNTRDLVLCDSLEAFYKRQNDDCALLSVLARRADIWDRRFSADSALAAVIKGIDGFSANCDTMILVELYAVKSNVHISLGDFEMAKYFSKKALEMWPNGQHDHAFKYGAMMNLANGHYYSGNKEECKRISLAIYNEALANSDSSAAMKMAANLGVMYAISGALDSAEIYFRKDLAWSKKNNNIRNLVSAYNHIGLLTGDMGDHEAAILILDSALSIAKQYDDLENQMNVLYSLDLEYMELGNVDSAYSKKSQYVTLRDSALNMEKIRAVTEMQEKYESEKKARQIQEMELEKLDDELAKERLTRTRNISLSIGLGVLLIAGGLFSRLRYVRRSRARIQKEKDRSEELLLNILPESVADELKEKGYADARQFEEISVLFTDFKGFTALSEKLSPAELVSEIDHCFKAFDVIIGNYGIEKIKTIGDAYMAAGGLHEPITSTPKDVVLAALEMQAFMKKEHEFRQKEGRPFFEMRVGIHTGPVVAGIVGVKKFQYDIWGDTVNTASRMESSGEVDKVNISECTFELLKQEADLHFEPRGKVAAKGKGEMEMFFVSMI